MRVLRRIPALLCVTLMTAITSIGHAATYPEKPVHIIVPYAPGGSPDLVARVLGQKLTALMGQQFVIENRPGGGGISAAQEVAHAAPDGYELLLSDIEQLAINPYLFKKLPYDPKTDFAPISQVGTVPLYIVAQPSLNINTLADLQRVAKAQPCKLTYGSSGIGSIHHITMESLAHGLGICLAHVPYKGSGQSTPAFIAGDVSLLISAMTSLQPYMKTGKVKLVAVTTAKRSPDTPDVPAVSETLPGFDFSSEMGLVAPAHTPPAILNALSTQIMKALQDPEVRKRFASLSVVPIGGTPAAYSENIQNNLKRFSTAVKLSGAQVN
jgi:tripartite-type tricarboxylate transporter receptor subunit TctC